MTQLLALLAPQDLVVDAGSLATLAEVWQTVLFRHTAEAVNSQALGKLSTIGEP